MGETEQIQEERPRPGPLEDRPAANLGAVFGRGGKGDEDARSCPRLYRVDWSISAARKALLR